MSLDCHGSYMNPSRWMEWYFTNMKTCETGGMHHSNTIGFNSGGCHIVMTKPCHSSCNKQPISFLAVSLLPPVLQTKPFDREIMASSDSMIGPVPRERRKVPTPGKMWNMARYIMETVFWIPLKLYINQSTSGNYFKAAMLRLTTVNLKRDYGYILWLRWTKATMANMDWKSWIYACILQAWIWKWICNFICFSQVSSSEIANISWSETHQHKSTKNIQNHSSLQSTVEKTPQKKITSYLIIC